MKPLQPEDLIAGPILRRTEKNRVCIWIATATNVAIKGEVVDAKWALSRNSSSNMEIIGEGRARCIQLGKKLFVSLVEISPKEIKAFPENRLLAYNLYFKGVSEVSKKSEENSSFWATAQPLSFFFPKDTIAHPREGIAYPGLKLPTFYISSEDIKENPPNILHGSCRKLHGEGGDALRFADDLIRKNLGIDAGGNRKELWKRPSALFLTGDQIYADDVSGFLIEHLMEKAKELIGTYERVPLYGDKSLTRKPSLRQLWRNSALKILSVEEAIAANHLFSFGEFAAMYLVAFHPAHWPDSLASSTNYRATAKEVRALRAARAEITSIRRILANIPTYMICDDHEVTDDWNFNEKWKARVEAHPLGIRLVTNALTAYWAFQAWGNDPDKFSYIADIVAENILEPRSEADFKVLENLFLKSDLSWTFITPTTPKAIFLDTRMRRKFERKKREDEGQGTVHPRLLNEKALEQLKQDIESCIKSNSENILLLVAPSPIFNIKLIEDSLESTASGFFRGFVPVKYGIRGYQQSHELADLELWHDNPQSYKEIVSILANARAKACIILSGDVHFAFAQEALLLKTGGQKESSKWNASVPFLQFTSSALQNKHVWPALSKIEQIPKRESRVKYYSLPTASEKEVEKLQTWKRGMLPVPDLLVRVALLDKTDVGEVNPKADKERHNPMSLPESNLGQLQILGQEIKHTFHMRPKTEEMIPGAPPAYDSPVVIYSLDKFLTEELWRR